MLLGLALRLPGIFRDLPFTYYGDEAHLIKRSMAIAAGDLNPHWFNKPALLMYVLAFAYGIMYLIGAAFGTFESPEHFAAWYLEDPQAFILVGRAIVCATGVGLIYLVFQAARRILKSDGSGLAAAAMAAVLGPLVMASQQVKADSPCAFLIMASSCAYLRADENASARRLVLASFLGGLAIGTKFYGIILVPAFMLGEFLRGTREGIAWKSTLGRATLIPVVFAIGFFVASPYHFLDPTWSGKVARSVRAWVDPAARTILYDPDNQVEYESGPSSLVGAAGHFLRTFVKPNVVGTLATLLMFLGAIAALACRATRRASIVPLTAVATFMLFAVTLSAYHTNFRHLTAILPLLCIFCLPLVALPRPRVTGSILLLLLTATLVIETRRDAIHNHRTLREDSRNRAHAWIVEHVPADARLLLDDYGPQLSPNPDSVRRIRERLDEFPKDEAFTTHRSTLLRIRTHYPARDGKNLDALGHPWWLEREPTEEELRAERQHREAGNPLVPRVPKSVDEYRRLGYAYIVTNSAAQAQYFDGGARGKRFPRWRAFYDALAETEPAKVFDPSDWGGKGPVVWIYRLTR